MDELVRCSVCHDVLPPPWRMCANSHVICAVDFANLGACPLCRASFMSASMCMVPWRFVREMAALAAAGVALTLPCAHDGCASRLAPDLHAAHRSVCPHRPRACCINGCNLMCTEDTIVAHLKTMHAPNIIAADEVMLLERFGSSSTWLFLDGGVIVVYSASDRTLMAMALHDTYQSVSICVRSRDEDEAPFFFCRWHSTLYTWNATTKIYSMIVRIPLHVIALTVDVVLQAPPAKRPANAANAEPAAKEARVEAAEANAMQIEMQ